MKMTSEFKARCHQDSNNSAKSERKRRDWFSKELSRKVS